jgi:YidC/Oxa1 family membrane protein insertase
MEKRMILAIAMSIAVLLGYQYLVPPPPQRAQNAAAPSKDNAAAAAAVATPTSPAAPVAGAQGIAAPGGVAAAAAAPVRTILIKTPLYTAGLSTEGGALASFRLDRYKDRQGKDGKPLEIVNASAELPAPLALSFGQSQPAMPASLAYSTDAPDEITLKDGESRTVVLNWASADGIRVTREYVFTGGRYDFEMKSQVGNGSAGALRLTPGVSLSQTFRGDVGDPKDGAFKGIVVDTKGGVERFDLKDIDKGKAARVPVRWAAADSKYFSIVVIPEKEWTLEGSARAGESGIRTTLSDNASLVAPGDTLRFNARVYAGPKEQALLEKSAPNLEKLVDFGWFAIVARPIVFLLDASNRVTRNYGIDIIILTILIKLVFYPLTHKSMTAMRKMQELTPIIQKMKEKHKDDPARVNQETMQLYKTYGVNPMSGCLPMLLQIPFLIAFYKALMVAIQLRHQPFALWITDLSAVEHLYDLHAGGMTVPLRLLPLLMGGSMFLQQKMTPSSPGADPAQQKMMLFLPLIFTFMFWSMPTGLTLYWFVSNIGGIVQQAIYNKQVAAAKAA